MHRKRLLCWKAYLPRSSWPTQPTTPIICARPSLPKARSPSSPTTRHGRSNIRSTSISMPSAISWSAASQNSNNSAASQPASKRQPEITVPSSLSQPASYGCDKCPHHLARLKSNLTIPFRIMLFAGLVLAPFLPRIRWLALPLFIGFWLWADTASYDLRNLLGLLLISASIPLYALARRLPVNPAAASQPRWNVPDAAVAGGPSAIAAALTLTLAQNNTQLKERFATDQLRGGPGFELNQTIAKLLQRGCAIFSADAISALQ